MAHAMNRKALIDGYFVAGGGNPLVHLHNLHLRPRHGFFRKRPQH